MVATGKKRDCIIYFQEKAKTSWRVWPSLRERQKQMDFDPVLRERLENRVVDNKSLFTFCRVFMGKNIGGSGCDLMDEYRPCLEEVLASILAIRIKKKERCWSTCLACCSTVHPSTVGSPEQHWK